MIDKKNDVACSLDALSGNVELKMNSLNISVKENTYEKAEEKLLRQISNQQDSENSKKALNICAVFRPSSENSWKTTRDSYRKYAVSRLIGNNIYTFVFILTLGIIFFCSPQVLTGTGYIAVISLYIILTFLSLTVFVSSLTEFFVKRSSFIEIRGNSAAVCTADKNFREFSVNIIERIDKIDVSKSHINVCGSITKNLYNRTFVLIKKINSEKISIPRIFANEENLLKQLEKIKETAKNA